jgi:calcineurin-like phosphoesterase family protein
MADPHIGHLKIGNYRKEIGSVEENTKIIVENYMKTINKRDTIYFLGDVAFDYDSLNIIKSLPGSKHLVMGNHDAEKKRKMHIREYLDCFDTISSLVKYKEFWLSHCPIHPQELRGKRNIHGHVHEYTVPDDNYINVCMEKIDYTPISLEEIRANIEQKNIG